MASRSILWLKMTLESKDIHFVDGEDPVAHFGEIDAENEFELVGTAQILGLGGGLD